MFNIIGYWCAHKLLSFYSQVFFLINVLLEIVQYQHINAICHCNCLWLFYIYEFYWFSSVIVHKYIYFFISDLEGDGFGHFLCDSVIDRFVSSFLEFLCSINGFLQLSPQVCRSGSRLLSVNQSLVSFGGVGTQGVGLTCINTRSSM